MTEQDVINYELFTAVNWCDPDAAQEFYYTKLEELDQDGYAALRETECHFTQIIDINH